MRRAYQDFVGWPFKPCGETIEGIDCLNLYRVVALRVHGLSTPNYNRMTEQARKNVTDFDYTKLASFAEDNLGRWTKVDKEKESDAVLMRIFGHPLHVGMVVDARRKDMLHIERGCNSIIESYNSVLWRDRVLGFYRWSPK